MKKHPKILKSLLSPTVDDNKVPTDMELDSKIEELSFYMHYIWPLLWYIIKKKTGFILRYKIWNRNTVIFFAFIVAMYFAWIKVAEPIFIVRERVEFVSEIHKELIKSPIPEENLRFMTAMSLFESRNNYKVSNGQFWGAFQMGNSARDEVGLECMDMKTFLEDSDIQNWAMNKLMHKNYEYLRDIIIKYKIPKKGGILVGNNIVTVSGLLATAHLVGASKAIDFVRSNGKNVAVDGNKTPLTKYLQLNGYDLEFKEK